MGRVVPIPLGELLGVNEDENPHSLEPGELVTGLNVVRWGNSMVGTRPGAQGLDSGEDYENVIDDGAAGNPAIQGMVDWRKDFDASRMLVVVADASSHTTPTNPPANLLREDDARYPAGTATITPGAAFFWTFAVHENALWGAGGKDGDSFWYLADPSDTGTGPVKVDLPKSAGNQIYPKYVFAWRGWMLACGLRDSTGVANETPDSNPTAIRYCTFGADPKTAANWLVGNTIGFDARRRGVDTYGSNFATGFANYQDNEGQWLLCLGNKHITSVQEDILNDFKVTDTIAPGCVSQRAFVSLGLDAGDAIYMSPTGTIHSLRQSQEHGRRSRTFLSWKIRKTIASLSPNHIKNTVGSYDPINGWVMFAVTTTGNSTHDMILALDTKDTDALTSETARWYIWRLAGITVNHLEHVHNASGVGYTYIGTTEGRILRFDTNTFSDLTGGYTARAQTAHNDFGNSLFSKTLGDVMLTVGPGGDYNPSCTFVFDYGNKESTPRSVNMPSAAADDLTLTLPGFTLPATLGAGSDIVGGDKLWGSGSGQTVGLRIEHTGPNQPWRVGNVVVELESNGEDVGNAPA